MPPPDLQAISDRVPLHRNLGLRVSRTAQGVSFRANVTPEYFVDQENGTVHGGIVASLLDTAATFALISQSDHDWVTVDLRVDYLRPTHGGSITIDAEVVRAGRSIGRATARVRDPEGVLCALGVGTFAPTPGK